MVVGHGRRSVVFALAGASLCTACALRTVHVEELDLSFARPMAVRAEVPLVILLDGVPVDYRVERGPSRPMNVTAVDQFVSRDFADLMSTYYSTVTVSTPGTPAPDGPHMVAVVRIDGIGVEFASTLGGLISTLDWSVGLRRSDGEDFVFTYANRVIGTQRAITIFDTPSMLGNTFEAALIDFARSYDASGAHQTVREANR